MKTMTCKQMGGSCDATIKGSTPDEMMTNGRNHVHSMDDDEHKKVITMMEEMNKDPKTSEKWNADFKAKFTDLPEDSE